MAIENAQRELFRTGTDFEQIRLLDNFYDNINVEGTSESDLIELLQLALKSGNDYIRRSAFKILCDLTLTNKVGNPFPALGELHNLLQCDEPSLLTVAIKYLPYFPQMHNSAVVEQLKELSDNSNGDLASQAYFYLGLLQTTEAISLSTVAEAITCLEKAKTHFQAATQSTENRVDADFYMLVIQWLESIFGNDSDLVQAGFDKIREILSTRSLYDFGNQDLELDFLIFQLVDQFYEPTIPPPVLLIDGWK